MTIEEEVVSKQNEALVQKIIDYVMETPHNTNPNVLRSILTQIFEEMTSVSNDINPGDVGDITTPGGSEKPIVEPVGS